MEQNGTELKVSPLLATRNEAKQGHNEANQGQMGPGINPLHTSALIPPQDRDARFLLSRNGEVSRERWGGVSLWLNLFYCEPLICWQ